MRLLDAALAYAAQGQPVFPCKAQGEKAKAPLTAHGFQDATTDLATIMMWWTDLPGAAIGIPTGILWDVLDVDCKPGGVDGYVALKRLRLDGFIDTQVKRVVSTPSGGMHLYFPCATDGPPMGNATFAKWGIDFRGLGGYVIAPPSTLYDSHGDPIGTYQQKSSRDAGAPFDHEAVRRLLAPPPAARDFPATGQARGSIQGMKTVVSRLAQGERNHGLYKASMWALDEGLDPWELVDTARAIGLDDGEIHTTIESALLHHSKKVAP